VTAPRFVDEEQYRPNNGLRIKATGTLAGEPFLPEPPDRARIAERRKLFRGRLDLYLVLVVGVLLAIGLMMVFSTTFDWSYQEFGDSGAIFMRQVQTMGIGLVIMILMALIDYRVWRKFALAMMLVVIALLIALLATAPELFGAQRAFINGSLQPGELAQLVTIIYMAAWLSAKQNKIRRLSYGLIPFSILIGSVTGLIVLQPDFSTAILILGTTVVMFFLAGADLIQMAVAGVLGGVAGSFLIQQVSHIYVGERLDSYLDSINNLTTASYHVQQAIVAFVRGGLTGVGLGMGSQKFGFLPAPHTDSIFAIIAEELGLVGCLLVTVLFIMLAFRGFRIARQAPDSFGALLAGGITFWIMLEALLNIAVMTALVPFTGVPLPFVSFGGSALVTSLAGVGILLNISRSAGREPSSDRRAHADFDLSRGDGGRSVPRVRRRGDAPGR